MSRPKSTPVLHRSKLSNAKSESSSTELLADEASENTHAQEQRRKEEVLYCDATSEQIQTDRDTEPKKNADGGAAHRAHTQGNAESVACRGFGQGTLGSVPTCTARQLEPNAEALQQELDTTRVKNRASPSPTNSSPPGRKSTRSPTNQNGSASNFAQTKFT
jgi:hypothetical protein